MEFSSMLVTSKTHSKIFLSRMFDSVAVPRNNSTSAWKPANVSLAAARRTSMAPVLKDQTCMAPLLNEGRTLFKKQKHIFFCIKVCQPIPFPLCDPIWWDKFHFLLAVSRCPEVCSVPCSMSRYSMIVHPLLHQSA